MTIFDDLRSIDSAVDQYALEANLIPGEKVDPQIWQKYFFKTNARLYNTGTDVFGEAYGEQTVDSLPNIPKASFEALSDVTPDGFWSPYAPAP